MSGEVESDDVKAGVTASVGATLFDSAGDSGARDSAGFLGKAPSAALLSASSAQLLPGVRSDIAVDDDGVAVPEAALLGILVAGTEGERPFAACAYEKPPEAESETDPLLRDAIAAVFCSSDPSQTSANEAFSSNDHQSHGGEGGDVGGAFCCPTSLSGEVHSLTSPHVVSQNSLTLVNAIDVERNECLGEQVRLQAGMQMPIAARCSSLSEAQLVA